MTTSTSPCRFAVLSLAVLAFAGCSSDGGPGERTAGFAGSRRPAPNPMAGQEDFFAGQILAEISVGTEGLPDAPVREGGSGGERESRGRRGGGGQLNIGGSGGVYGGNISGGVPFGGGGEGRGRRGGEGGGTPGPRMMTDGGRPVMIHLRFTNRGAVAVTLQIDDFVSPFGNFAVRPEQLVLAPGQSLETEPMTSQLAGQFTETNATLVLRLGPKAEKKTFRLKAVAPSPEPSKEN